MAGVAIIKQEFIVKNEAKETEEPDLKKLKVEDGSGENKSKKQRGQFKNRFKINRVKNVINQNICNSLINVTNQDDQVTKCDSEKCKYLHDVQEYLKNKLPDISEECYVFNLKGHCPRGVTCRFGKSHLTDQGLNIVNENVKKTYELSCLKTQVFLNKDLQISLRKKSYNFQRSVNILDRLINKTEHREGENEKEEKTEDVKCVGTDVCLGSCTDEDIIKLRQREKKKIDWKNKLYLSPLTTLGNIPFRRICKEYGADITCGEMAMATSLLQGLTYEWALTKRHESETLFGVQICGNNPYAMTRCTQLLEEKANVDFIDVNLGCPIDLVYKKGGGSGLLRRENVLSNVVKCMSAVTHLPITVKTRTGVYMDKNVAHKLMPMFRDNNVSLITVHGRSREQRYTRTSDWTYINECAGLASPVPVFGNGDILSYKDYNEVKEKYNNISGVMIGRGALYKPWIFTEINEEREWDISSSERFEILKKFVNYGLENWGSDDKGVEVTRKFLLEWLSFLYRYIPVGLLEHPPQKINERPPKYKGRNDLETLMSSPNCSCWIKISEMLLGPVPDSFQFLPKHKANSWSNDAV